MWGLGVCLTEAPETIDRSRRILPWLQIQPGLAIDSSGNPLVVPEPIAFPIASPAPLTGELTVYITLRHSDPDNRQEPSDRDVVQESIRIDEIVTPPAHNQLELCRIRLQPGEAQLIPCVDVLQPGANQLDLRYRVPVQARSPHQVQVAYGLTRQVAAISTPTIGQNWAYLLQALPGLYPALQGSDVQAIPLTTSLDEAQNLTLLYLTHDQWVELSDPERSTLRHYLSNGTTALVELSAQAAGIAELGKERQRLRGAIDLLDLDPDVEAEQQVELAAELRALEADIACRAEEAARTVWEDAQDMGVADHTSGTIDRHHLLRTTPFLFAQWPIVNHQPLHLYHWGGIVVVIGSLSSAWGLDETLSLPRETIRSAQELGINLLHFACYRQQLLQLQRTPTSGEPGEM